MASFVIYLPNFIDSYILRRTLYNICKSKLARIIPKLTK